jgi:predicted transcriptional regulator
LESLTKILKAAANKNRLNILRIMLDGKAYSIGEISEYVNLPYKTTARNLKLLERFNYLKSNVNSAVTYYQINGSRKLTYNQLIFSMIKISEGKE